MLFVATVPVIAIYISNHTKTTCFFLKLHISDGPREINNPSFNLARFDFSSSFSWWVWTKLVFCKINVFAGAATFRSVRWTKYKHVKLLDICEISMILSSENSFKGRLLIVTIPLCILYDFSSGFPCILYCKIKISSTAVCGVYKYFNQKETSTPSRYPLCHSYRGMHFTQCSLVIQFAIAKNKENDKKKKKVKHTHCGYFDIVHILST